MAAVTIAAAPSTVETSACAACRSPADGPDLLRCVLGGSRAPPRAVDRASDVVDDDARASGGEKLRVGTAKAPCGP